MALPFPIFVYTGFSLIINSVIYVYIPRIDHRSGKTPVIPLK